MKYDGLKSQYQTKRNKMKLDTLGQMKCCWEESKWYSQECDICCHTYVNKKNDKNQTIQNQNRKKDYRGDRIPG